MNEEKISSIESTHIGGEAANCHVSSHSSGPRELLKKINYNTYNTAVNTAIGLVNNTPGSFTLLGSRFVLSDKDPLEVVPKPRVLFNADVEFEECVPLFYIDPESLRSFYIIPFGCYYIFVLVGCKMDKHKLASKLECCLRFFSLNGEKFSFALNKAFSAKSKNGNSVLLHPGRVFLPFPEEEEI